MEQRSLRSWYPYGSSKDGAFTRFQALQGCRVWTHPHRCCAALGTVLSPWHPAPEPGWTSRRAPSRLPSSPGSRPAAPLLVQNKILHRSFRTKLLPRGILINVTPRLVMSALDPGVSQHPKSHISICCPGEVLAAVGRGGESCSTLPASLQTGSWSPFNLLLLLPMGG